MELLERKGIRLIVHLPEEVDHHHTEENRRKVDAVIFRGRNLWTVRESE